MTTERKLLFVTPYFPPASGSGVQRGAKFVKYLMRDGWKVRVLTIDPDTYHVHDPSLLEDVAGAEVKAVRLSRIPGVHHRVLRALPGLRRALPSAFREFRPDAVLATTPDFHWPLIARAAKREGVPLVLDYPDPWTVLPADFRIFSELPKARSRIKWRVAPALERRCLNAAAAAVFSTEPIFDEYARAMPRAAAIGTVITNGFDPEDFDGSPVAAKPLTKGAALRIAHVGSFAGMRSPVPMAEAVKQAASLTPVPLEVVLVGDGAAEHEGRLRQVLGGSASLTIKPWLAHREALAEMQAASILWLDAMVHFRAAATGKIFEYLRCARPIFALAHPQSPAAELIEAFDAGTVVGSNSPDQTGPALASLVEKVAAGKTSVPDPARLAAYDRGALALRMSALLASVSR